MQICKAGLERVKLKLRLKLLLSEIIHQSKLNLGSNQTLNLGLLVQQYQTICFRWRRLSRLHGWIKQGQHHGCQVLAHFLGVKVGMCPLIYVVTAGEFGERPGSPNGRIGGSEAGVYDKPAIKYQEGLVEAVESVVVDSFIGEVDEHLKGQKEPSSFEVESLLDSHFTRSNIYLMFLPFFVYAYISDKYELQTGNKLGASLCKNRGVDPCWPLQRMQVKSHSFTLKHTHFFNIFSLCLKLNFPN